MSIGDQDQSLTTERQPVP